MYLVHMYRNRLRPVGGPSGYLFNLNSGLSVIGCDEIDFLPPEPLSSKVARRISYYCHYVKALICCKKTGQARADASIRVLLNHLNSEKKAPVDYSAYGMIHFHETLELYAYRASLKNYKGTILLTSHSPCAMHVELVDTYCGRASEEALSELRRVAEQADLYAFTHADCIVFPCKEAEEPYYHSWPAFAALRPELRVEYLLTGALPAETKICREDIRTRYGIPNDAFVVSFVGRHNEVKGYPDLVEIGERILRLCSNVFFLIAGAVDDTIAYPHSDRWIEVGWTNNPHSIISASDLFVLPNRETYFDLVLLEVLSLDIPILLSRTGGNKWFEQYDAPMIDFFSTVNEACSIIEEKASNNETSQTHLGKTNKELFEEHFTNTDFAKNYLALLKSLG